MLRYMKENKKVFAGYLLLVPASGLCSSLFAMCLEPLVNVVYTKDAGDFARYALLAVVLGMLDMAGYYLLKISRERLRNYYMAGLRRDLFEGILKRNVVDFHSASVAEYVSIMNRDVEKMNTHHFDSACGFYRVSINFVINLVLVIRISPWIAVFNIGTSLVSAFIPRLFEKQLCSRQEKASEKASEYQGLLADYLNGFTTIKLFHIQDIIKQRIEKANRKLEKANFDSSAANYTASWFSILCSNFSFVMTTILGVWFCLKGWMTVGQVVAVSQMIGGIVVPFEELPEYLANYKSVKGIREKLWKIIDSGEAVRGEKLSKRLPSQTGQSQIEQPLKEVSLEIQNCDIQIQNVDFSYDAGEPHIKDISLSLLEGKKYILVGQSGSGKSTLAKLAMGFYSCSAGSITLDGRLLSEYSEEQFFHTVTYLEQSVFLFDDSLLHNLTLYRKYSAEEIKKALRIAGLDGFVAKLPKGLDTMMQGNGGNLSGGEKQRIGIARAILAGTRFLVLDEATANLDPILAADIEERIMDAADIGVLLITHKWSERLLRKCDRIFVMRGGKLVEQGDFDALMTRKEYFYSYFLSAN